MSCERSSSSVSTQAGPASGITTAANKASFSYGTVCRKVERMMGQGMATGLKTMYTFHEVRARGEAVGAYMLNIAGPQAPEGGRGVARSAAGTTAKLALIVAMKHPGVRLGVKIAKSANVLTKLTGSGVGALSKTKEAGQVLQEKQFGLFFKKQVPVALWKSKLTNLLNRADVVGDPGKIISSSGVMFRPGKLETWHRGTTVVKVPDGKRTITHLQTLAYPQRHYYFDRPISDEASVGIAAGSLKPETVPGYVGRISELEGLSPNWLMAKQSLIKSYLHYGPKS